MNGIRDPLARRRTATGYAALVGILALCELTAERVLSPAWGGPVARLAGEALPVFGLLGALALLLSRVAAAGPLRVLRQVRRGMGWLPDYGHHPGTGLLIALIGAGAVAGARGGGWEGAIAGAGAMLVLLGAIYAWGAYDRAEGQDRRRQAGQEHSN
ncbi:MULTISPECIES: hypothetical protein [unclassified Xanthobacter]|uniref:hypothetical protein n=1 Tax=unclassified Xanthobacter TaxID=2623496 RepID=UPI001F3B96DC|nr:MULTISPECIES: hypothetical protein [unclassified Xanthobacter]